MGVGQPSRNKASNRPSLWETQGQRGTTLSESPVVSATLMAEGQLVGQFSHRK